MSDFAAEPTAASPSRLGGFAAGLVTAVRWLAVAAALPATVLWAQIVEGGSDWGAVLFLFYVVPWVLGGTLLLGVVPSFVLWRLRRTARDRRNLIVTSSVSAALLLEAFALLFVPLGLC